MFPKILDNAEVLYYTVKDDFGEIYYSTGEAFDVVKYLAICKYPNTENAYYLFQVNDSYEVIGDFLLDTTDECMRVAKSFYSGNIFWIEAEREKVPWPL